MTQRWSAKRSRASHRQSLLHHSHRWEFDAQNGSFKRDTKILAMVRRQRQPVCGARARTAPPRGLYPSLFSVLLYFITVPHSDAVADGIAAVLLGPRRSAGAGVGPPVGRAHQGASHRRAVAHRPVPRLRRLTRSPAAAQFQVELLREDLFQLLRPAVEGVSVISGARARVASTRRLAISNRRPQTRVD